MRRHLLPLCLLSLPACIAQPEPHAFPEPYPEAAPMVLPWEPFREDFNPSPGWAPLPGWRIFQGPEYPPPSRWWADVVTFREEGLEGPALLFRECRAMLDGFDCVSVGLETEVERRVQVKPGRALLSFWYAWEPALDLPPWPQWSGVSVEAVVYAAPDGGPCNVEVYRVRVSSDASTLPGTWTKASGTVYVPPGGACVGFVVRGEGLPRRVAVDSLQLAPYLDDVPSTPGTPHDT